MAAAVSAEEWQQQQATWNEWVKALMEKDFNKVTVIVRPHNMDNGQPHPYAWSPLAYSAADCVATQWEKTDAEGTKSMVCAQRHESFHSISSLRTPLLRGNAILRRQYIYGVGH